MLNSILSTEPACVPSTHLQALDLMLSSRISRRILAEHHVALHTQFYSAEKNPNIIGILSLACDACTYVCLCT